MDAPDDSETAQDDSDLEEDVPALDDKDDDKCAICIDRFRRPKLLPCGHTFCLDCLNNMSTSSNRRDRIICPMCRKTSTIPQNGIVDFITNYFIPCPPNFSTCQVCDHRASNLITCPECGLEFCSPCSTGHGKDKTFGRNRCVNATYEDRELYDYQRQLRQLRNVVKTFYCAMLEFSFSCPYEICVIKILPLPGHEAWVLTNNSNEIVKYNRYGNCLSQIRIGIRIDDICQKKDCVLALCNRVKSLFLYKDSEIMKVLELLDVQPCCLLALDKSLVIAVSKEISVKNKECELHFYDDEFTFIHSVGKREIGSLKHINAMAYKSDCGKICLADEVSGCVRLISEGGPPVTYVKQLNFPTRYRGGGFNNARYLGFKPKSLCCDSWGNLFVYDHASAMILIIDSSGRLLGVLITNDEDLAGDPNCLSFDGNGKLWIGDAFTGRVRVYKVDKTYNDLIPGAIPDCDNEQNFQIPSRLVGNDGNLLSIGKNILDMPLHRGMQMSSESSHMGSSFMPFEQNVVEYVRHAELQLSELQSNWEAVRNNMVREGIAIPDDQDQHKTMLQIATDQLSLLKRNIGMSTDDSPGDVSTMIPKTAIPSPGNLTETRSVLQRSQNIPSPGDIEVSLPMNVNGTPVSSANIQAMSGITPYGVLTRREIGVLSTGPFGITVNLPTHIVNNPQSKEAVLHQVSLQTGIPIEQLANCVRAVDYPNTS